MIRLALLLYAAFFSITATAILYDTDKQDIFATSILKNGGFEDGVARWTASGGTYTVVTSGTNLLTGKVSGTWDSGSAAQTLTSTAVAIPKGLYSKNGLLQCKIQTPSGTATHTISAYDGSTTLASTTITSSTIPTFTQLNFIYPSSGNIQLRLTSVAADEPLIAIDDCFMGEAINIASVSQAQFIGSAYIDTTASCSWSRTNSAFGGFTADADCPGPTVDINPGPGAIQTTDADLPKFTVNNLPPGTYEVTVTGPANVVTGGISVYTVNDGTTTAANRSPTPVGGAGFGSAFSFSSIFVYTTTANRTFEVYGANSTGTITIDLSTGLRRLYFQIKKYPSATDQALTAATSAASWSGYHDSTCSWARTNTAYGDPTADATCTLTERTNTNFGTVTSYLSGSDKLPGIVFTPAKIGKYKVCALIGVQGATNGADTAVKLWDGTTTIAEMAWDIEETGGQKPVTVCSLYSATSLAAKTISIQTKSSTGAVTIQPLTSASAIEWSIFNIDQQFPAPLIVNSVVNSSTGVTTTEVAKLNCDAGSAITSQHGTWVSSIGNIATGACAITLTSRFSATPYCSATLATTGGISAGKELNVDATSATAVSVDCEDDASTACTDFDFILACTGAK